MEYKAIEWAEVSVDGRDAKEYYPRTRQEEVVQRQKHSIHILYEDEDFNQFEVDAEFTIPLNEKEINLIQKLNDYGAAVAQAGQDYSPSGIANYCYELTKEFNQFYHDYSILNAESQEEKITRLVLANNVGKVIKNGMALLGIEVPERM